MALSVIAISTSRFSQILCHSGISAGGSCSGATAAAAAWPEQGPQPLPVFRYLSGGW